MHKVSGDALKCATGVWTDRRLARLVLEILVVVE